MRYIFSKYKERIITGAILFAIVFTVGTIDNLIGNSIIIWLFLGIGYIIAFYETTILFEIESKILYGYAGLIWILAYLYPHPENLFFLISIILASKIAFSQNYIDRKLIIPFIYPTVGFIFIFTLSSDSDFGLLYLIWLLVIVSLTDIAAFIGGKIFGKRQFSPTSPTKTWEGVFIGVGVGTISGTIISFLFISAVGLFSAIIISFLVSISSIFGDLFESYLKRESGEKDSGSLLPGHGGILDRVDGYLFGGIIMVILSRIFI